MAKIKIPIQLYRGSTLLDDHSVMLGEAFMKRWKIPAGAPLLLKFGSMRRDVRVVPVSGLAAMRVGDTLAGHLGLTGGMQLCLQYKPASRTLHIGPLLGVLVSRVFAGNPEQPLGSMTSFGRELSEACRMKGAHVFFFTPDDIPAQQPQSISGWSYAGRWTKRTYPIPDIVYNRLTSRKLENNPSVQHFVKEVKSRYGTPMFNEKYLNKTDVFQALRGDSSLHGYLPESHSFKNFAMLKEMLDRYAVVFLKPITGSLGKGIIRISRQDGGFAVDATRLGGVRRQTFPTLAQAFQSFSGKLKQQRYQIQQGLHLIEAGGRPIDFRALVQRDGEGQWTVTSVVARIAPGGSFVSNIARGGTLSPVKEALAKSSLAPSLRAGSMAKLRKAAVEIAQGVETRIPAHFAELGIDFAIDPGGRVWLIEVNSKPSKDDNTPLENQKIRPSVRKLLDYAQHLAKF